MLCGVKGIPTMPRKSKMGFPKPIPDIANQVVAEVPSQEVEWPGDYESPDSELNFNFTYVIHDRIKPRLFTTLGKHYFPEFPVNGHLVGNEYGLTLARTYHNWLVNFIQHTNARFKILEDRMADLEATQNGIGNDSQSA